MRYRMVNGEQGAELALINDTGDLRAMSAVWAGLADRFGANPKRPSIDELLASSDPAAFADAIEAQFESGNELPASAPALVPMRGGDLLCIGRNYAAHAAELGNEVPGEPIVFMKPRASLIANCEPILLPEGVEEVHYEGELALVIGARLNGPVSPEQARSSLFGITLMDDVTDRAKQSQLKEGGKPWLLAKGRSTFAPLGPDVLRLKNDDRIEDLTLTTRVNGELRQEGTPKLWLFSLSVLVDTLSRAIGLRPGDIIATGTPKGVGAVGEGDEVVVSCDRIGTLSNRIAKP